MKLLKKLRNRGNWHRIFYERLAEPLHLNALSCLVGLFGSFRQKVKYDLVLRHCNAYGILEAADHAKRAGLTGVCAVEFGVAAGTGLINMCLIARKVSALTGIDVKIYGFDTGKGMPPPRDYRDHPDVYQEGDFPSDPERLKKMLPANGELILGELAESIPLFLKERLNDKCPIGYVVLDVDYYSSSVDALKLFEGRPELYLPATNLYMDDIDFQVHNPFAGELLAMNEFNERHQFRKICRHDFLQCYRLFQRAWWIKHMFTLHVMDHPARNLAPRRACQELPNQYL